MKRAVCLLLMVCLFGAFALAEGRAPGLSFDAGFAKAKDGAQGPAEETDEAAEAPAPAEEADEAGEPPAPTGETDEAGEAPAPAEEADEAGEAPAKTGEADEAAGEAQAPAEEAEGAAGEAPAPTGEADGPSTLDEGGDQTFELRFDEGFSLRIPRGWVSYPIRDAAIRYALGDGEGRYLYILGKSADFADFEAMRAALDAREDCGKASPLDLNGQPFAAFIVPGLNASGCATLLDGEAIVFLFTPQNDSDYMLAVAQIMASFENTLDK